MRRFLLRKAVSLILLAGVFSPWATILVSPQYAFAATVQLPQNSAAANQAGRQGGSLSINQAAAAGVVSVGGCLAAAGITLGSVFTYIGALLGFNAATSAATPAGVGAAAIGLTVPVVAPATDILLEGIKANTYATAHITGAQLNKDTIFDCIAWALAKAIWRAIAASVIDWINSGFNGRPAFIQNLQRFMLGIADTVVGSIIQADSALSFLCSPFSLNVKLALAVTYSRRSAPSCTLTQVMQNIRGFMNSFSQGGWPAWIELNQENNNPYSAYIIGRATIDINITNAQGRRMSLLNWSGGFLSKTENTCDYAQGAASAASCREIIVTPGELIAQKAGQVIGEGNVQILLADELNEIFEALVMTLLQKALESFSGLSGNAGYQDDYYRYSSYTGDLSGPSGSGSYTADLGAGVTLTGGTINPGDPGSAFNTGNGISTGDALSGVGTGNGISTGNAIATGNSLNPGGTTSAFGGGTFTGQVAGATDIALQINDTVLLEQELQQINQTAINRAQASQTLANQVAACWNGKAGQSGISFANASVATANAQIATANNATLASKITKFQSAITTSAANVTTLNNLLAQASAAITQEGLVNVLYAYYSLLGNVHTATLQTIQTTNEALANLQATLDPQDAAAQASLTQCAAFPPPETTTSNPNGAIDAASPTGALNFNQTTQTTQ